MGWLHRLCPGTRRSQSQCITWQPSGQDFGLATCNGRPYQEFLYIDDLIYSEGASPGNTPTYYLCSASGSPSNVIAATGSYGKTTPECLWPAG